ncbi:MAG: 3D domain-containing protein [Alicyclobacillus sp.]|nr:3D domain-containing protein [Alicyclobacillus sp.]
MNADERPAAVAVLSRTSSQGNRTDVGVARVQAGTRVRSTSEPASFAVPQRATDTVPKRELGEFIVTAYALTPRSTGKVPGQPGFGVTASGTRAQVGRTIAVDPSVIPMGSLVYIDLPGVGWRLAEDTGGAIQGRHIDLLLPSDNAALSFGVKRKVHVYIVAR